ncbi:MAG: LPS-assembly protein LptD [Thermodesulfobacteriota bacterium]
MKITVEAEGPVEIEADQLIYDRDQQLYQADGGVEVKRGALYLKADHAQVSMATKEMTAWGNVVLREGEDVIECKRLEINLNTRTGKIHQAKLFLKDQNFHITGQELEKLGENRYRILDGSFTTCDGERPPWKFTVKELNVELGGYGIARSPIFYIKDVPILYLPFGVFPVVLERQTGFLFPRFGYSSKYGPEVRTAFFWAMAKNMDSSFYLDWVEERGFKEGLEYRYAFARDTRGEAKGYFTDDRVFGDQRYAFFLKHQQRFPYDSYLKWDINHVSDHQYVRDYDEDLPEGAKIDSRSLRQMRSVLFGGKNWDRYSLLMNVAVFDDLSKESNDETLQKLPQIGFFGHPQPLWKTPLFFDLTSTYNHFWRERGLNAHRWDFFPKISYPVRIFNVLKMEASVGGRETLYRLYQDPTNRFDPWESRETFEAGTQISAEFFRIFRGGENSKMANFFKVNRWMHTVEPHIGYLYSPRITQDDLPIFDEVDRLSYTNQITYGIVQRLVGKWVQEGRETAPYEYARLDLLQSYSLGDPYGRDSKGKGRYFSNIQAELWWNFSPFLSARWDAEVSPYDRSFQGFNFLMTAKDQRNDAVQVQYRYTKKSVEEINVAARVRTISPLHLFGSIRYNLVDHWKVENVYGLEYRAQCWTFGLALEDRGKSPDGTQKKELKVQVYFHLLNLGSLGRKSYLLDF